jgi:hypothetical protein
LFKGTSRGVLRRFCCALLPAEFNDMEDA